MKTDGKKYGFLEKWSEEIEQYNFTQVPNLLLACQGHLGLTDGEILTLIHLMTFWFDNDGKVYPSITTLTKFSHKSYKTVQKRLRSLEEKGFLKRKRKFHTSSTYELVYTTQKLYQHQKICVNLPRKRDISKIKIRHQHTSISTDKEYEVRTRRIYNNTKKSIPEILADRRGVWL